jgi:phosphatidylglycerophosphate synthase
MDFAGDCRVNVPNTITLVGVGLGLWWVAGGPAWAGLVSIVADELDGRIARRLGQTSDCGSQLDWTSDVVLTSMTLGKLRAPVWATLATLVGQVALRERGFRPSFGSARAALMFYAILRDSSKLRGLVS